MSYIGKTPTAVPLTSSDITDGIITLPKLTDGTDGNIISYDASGNPVAVATGTDGQVLTSTGAGSPPAFEALPAGGITHFDQWRLTSEFDGGGEITSNLEQVDNTGVGLLGSAMTQSSGIFTFPVTGLWLITYNISYRAASDGSVKYAGGFIKTTTNNSTYSDPSGGYNSIIDGGGENTYANSHFRYIFDVTNVSNDKVKFAVSTQQAGSTVQANTDTTYTGFTFLRLSDT
jgi:hypothetical protein